MKAKRNLKASSQIGMIYVYLLDLACMSLYIIQDFLQYLTFTIHLWVTNYNNHLGLFIANKVTSSTVVMRFVSYIKLQNTINWKYKTLYTNSVLKLIFFIKNL